MYIKSGYEKIHVTDGEWYIQLYGQKDSLEKIIYMQYLQDIHSHFLKKGLENLMSRTFYQLMTNI